MAQAWCLCINRRAKGESRKAASDLCSLLGLEEGLFPLGPACRFLHQATKRFVLCPKCKQRPRQWRHPCGHVSCSCTFPVCPLCHKEFGKDDNRSLSTLSDQDPRTETFALESQAGTSRAGQNLQIQASATSHINVSAGGRNELACIDDEEGNGMLQWKGDPKPRRYQWQAFGRATEENCIINLPTGTGKTLVAVMLLDHFLKKESSKHVMMLVNTVALVRQQARVIRQSSTTRGLAVAELAGSEVEWTGSSWAELFAAHQVLVGTADMFRKALVDHGFININQMSLIIFDEAHHAVGNHPYVMIVDRARKCKTDREFREFGPRIVGLTASFLHGKMANPERKRMKLEANLFSRIWAPDPKDLEGFVSEQNFEFISYDQTSMPEDLAKAQTETILSDVLDDGDFPKDTEKLLRNLALKASYVFELLGSKGWQFFMKEGLCLMVEASLQTKKRVFDKQRDKDKVQQSIKHINSLQAKLKVCVGKSAIAAADHSHDLSGKTFALLERLKELQDFAEEADETLRSIVFVEQVATTYPLAALINEHLGSPAALPVSGTSSMPDHVRQRNLESFARGQAQILVATNSLEEGIDIPSCNSVFRFDIFHNVKSHVQGAGRARHRDARIFYFENDPEAEQRDAERMLEVARGTVGPISEQTSGSATGIPTHPFPFEHPTTGACLTAQNCLGILFEYVARVLKKSLSPDSIFVSGTEQSTIEKCRVPVPTSDRHLEILEISAKDVDKFWCSACGKGTGSASDFRAIVCQGRLDASWSDISCERRRFAYVVVWRLLQEGYMNEHNMPSETALHAKSEHCKELLDAHESGSASCQIRYRPESIMRAFNGSMSSGQDEETVRTRFSESEGTPVNATISSVQSVRSSDRFDDSVPAHVASDSHATYVLRNAKGKLNELMMKVLRRSVKKGDVQYVSRGGPPFVATVTLVHIEGSPSFEGQQCSTKVDAEQSAASRALDAAGTWSRSTNRHSPPESVVSSSLSVSPSDSASCAAEKLSRSKAQEQGFQSAQIIADQPELHSTAFSVSASNADSRTSHIAAKSNAEPPESHVGNAASAAAAHRLSDNPKGTLTETLQKMLRRSLQKGDVEYEYKSAGGPPFVATVILVALQGKPRFEGESYGTKVDAEQSAAKKALQEADTWSRLSSLNCPSRAMANSTASASPSGIVSCTAENFSSSRGQEHGSQSAHSINDQPALRSTDAFSTLPAAQQQINDEDLHIRHMADAQSNTTSTMTIGEWCASQQLPEELAQRLEDEDVQSPLDLKELSAEDLEQLCKGLKIGQKGRFLKSVKSLP